MKENQNILMVAYTNYLTDPRVIREAEAANEEGFSVDFISLRKKGESNKSKINNISVYRVRQFRYRGTKNRKYFLSYLEFLFRSFFWVNFLHFKNKYKIIHVNNMPDFLVFCAIIPKILGVKIILDIHDPMPFLYLTKFQGNRNNLLYKFFQFQERISAKFANSIITVHEPIKRDILVNDGLLLDKIHIVANFADEELFKLSSEYKINKPIKLVFHGTIAERFGLHKVIDALKSSNNPDDFQFKIIGEGDFAEQLKESISKFGMENIVDFENRMYPVIDLATILKEYHVGLVSYDLSPATNYMLPVKMMEYISMGLPVITVQNVPIKHYFGDQDCFYYNPSKLTSLTELFNSLSQNIDQIYEKREKTISFREKFLWSKEKQKYIELLRSLT